MLDKNRIIALTDAIIAVAATVMVLQLEIPKEATLAAIQEQFPTLISYIISFLQVFMAWHEHHDTFGSAEKINHRIYLINVVWVFFITLLPFATGMVGNNPDNGLSVRIYIFILFMITIVLKIESVYVTKLNGNEITDKVIIDKLRVISLITYVVAAAVTFIMPAASMVIIIFETILEIILIWQYDKRDKELGAVVLPGKEEEESA